VQRLAELVPGSGSEKFPPLIFFNTANPFDEVPALLSFNFEKRVMIDFPMVLDLINKV